MTNNQLLIDMLMQLSNRTMRSDELGGSRDWLVAEISSIISHAQDGHDERVFTESEVGEVLRAVMSAAEDGPYIPNYERMREAASRFGLSFD